MEPFILSIFDIHPGILGHFALIQIDVPTAKNIKIIIEQICNELMNYHISVVGLTTDNGANFVKCFKEIENDVFINHSKFLLLDLLEQHILLN